MHVTSLKIEGVAGYDEIVWRNLNRERNLLFGPNGAGKSSVLQAIGIGLKAFSGKHHNDLFTRTYPNARVVLSLADPAGEVNVKFSEVREPASRRLPVALDYLDWAEIRQPKSRVGKERTKLLDPSLRRYSAAVSEIHRLLQGTKEEQQVASDALELARTVLLSGPGAGWDWLEKELCSRSQNDAHPLSCGQFDFLAIALDLVRVRGEGHTRPVFVVIDNPETFLHPACLMPMLDAIRNCLPEAQLFAATHSLKLLAHAASKTVFFLSRLSQVEGRQVIDSVLHLEQGAQSGFFELYGEDVSSAVLELVSALDSAEYYRYLATCAVPEQPIVRRDPASDPQVRAVAGEVVRAAPWVILDFGAGAGDLLAGMKANDGSPPTYFAFDPYAPPELALRIQTSKESGAITASSRVVERLEDAGRCNRVALVNVAHNLFPPDRLAETLAKLLCEVLPLGGAIVVHEMRTLVVGESNFLLWTPDDFRAVFSDVPGVGVTSAAVEKPGRVALDTTIIERVGEVPDRDECKRALSANFVRQTVKLRERCAAELRALLANAKTGLDEAIRQRRVAFLMAQISHSVLATTP